MDRFQSKGTKNAISVKVDDSFCLTSDWTLTKIEFRSVCFHYPYRPTRACPSKISALLLKIGQSVSLVGPSSRGKSTVFQLLQRLYDPTPTQEGISSGAIYITFQNSSGVTVEKDLKSVDPL